MSAEQPPRDKPRQDWQVVRIFSGEKSPEELLRALIQAHQGGGAT